MLKFSTMYAVDGPFLNYKIRDIPGDEAAWVIRDVDGVVFSNGFIAISVRGLIFANGAPNDAATFRAVVSCKTEASETVVSEAKVQTREFPADPQGNSIIIDKVNLPNPCVAPVVFILPGDEDKWFAVTGAGD